MKIYKKKYENILGKNLAMKREDFDANIKLYVKAFCDNLNQRWESLWRQTLMTVYLRENFDYLGRKYSDKLIGEMVHVFSSEHFITNVDSYGLSLFGDFIKRRFPNIKDKNPEEFPDDYIFPFNKLAYIAPFMAQGMDDPDDLLNYGDDHEMDVHAFASFLANQVCSENEEYIVDKYIIRSALEQ